MSNFSNLSHYLAAIKFYTMESIKFIGKVHSPLKEIGDCPLLENEGAPAALVSIYQKYQQAILGLKVGSKVLLFTWLHLANRTALTTKPRNNPNANTTGVFATRSPDRPNPIGIHVAEVLEITNGEIKISNLEVIDGTPVIDIKPVLNNQML
jgi:tRNA-Thr(GGU) m(6)t(6)A37 methyltransferase TsaA